MEEFGNMNLKIDENDRKFSKRAENNVEKGRIARYEQLLLFQQCFQETFTVNKLKHWLVLEKVKSLPSTSQLQISTTFQKTVFENNIGKGGNSGNQHYFLFQKCFLP